MKLGMYSICDKETSYIFPFPAMSDNAAVRNFAVEINTNPIAKSNPQDFELFLVGTFDTETGTVETYVPNKHIRSGLSLRSENE